MFLWTNYSNTFNNSIPLQTKITFSKLQDNIKEALKCKEQSLRHFDELDNPFTEKEIRNGLKKLKNKKAPGNDRIRSEMLKYGCHLIITSLTKLFNLILGAGTFPNSWSMGLITPIFKTGDKSDNNNNNNFIYIHTLTYK